MADSAIVIPPTLPTGTQPPAASGTVTSDGETSRIQVDTSTPVVPVVDSKPAVPEKFRNADGSLNADALLKSYTELETQRSKAPAVETPVVTSVEKTLSADDLKALNTEFKDTGKISDETLAKHKLTREVVDAHIAGQTALVEKHIAKLQETVGGKTAFEAITEWAGANLSEQEVDSINSVLSAGNEQMSKLTLEGLKARYEKATGIDPALIRGTEGTPGTSGIAPYRSSMEVTDAISDKRYKRDPAYRKEVEQRLARTPMFGQP